jgi:hypothetical protein
MTKVCQVTEAVEQIISAWAFAHNIDGAARNDLFARLRVARIPDPEAARLRATLKRLFEAEKFHDPDDWRGEPAMIEAAQVLGEPPFDNNPLTEAETNELVERINANPNLQPLPSTEADNCELCFGRNGGVRGNENIIGGLTVCDYCHVKLMPFLTASTEAAKLREALRGLVQAVEMDAHENNSISGYTGARLSDARDALNPSPALVGDEGRGDDAG